MEEGPLIGMNPSVVLDQLMSRYLSPVVNSSGTSQNVPLLLLHPIPVDSSEGLTVTLF